MEDNSIDAIITDSPYGLGKEPDAVKCLQDWINHGYHEVKGRGFMGKSWDAFVPQPILWKECFRVLKPGGYLLSFFGTRTYDWGTLAIRLAGFEIRDCIMWIYGSGFPKSLDVSKAIDKAAGDEKKVMSEAPTEEAKKWKGFGTALKPACEPICVARKPLEGTVIENVLKHGTGAIHIDAGRIGTDKDFQTGRWPANIIHDGSDEVLKEFPDATGQQSNVKGTETTQPFGNIYSGTLYRAIKFDKRSDEGSAARFFYCAKASPSERAGRKHPTIKPLKLMEYLVKVFCPKDGVVLDPHFGSGTTGGACLNSGRKFIGIDNDKVSVKEAELYLQKWLFTNP